MDIKVNAVTLTRALNDNSFKTELIEYLNSVVDEELENGEYMDIDLIEECTELLFDLEKGYEVLNIERKAAKKIIKFCHKKTVNKTRYRQIAAAIAVILIAHTATYASVPAYAEAVDNIVEVIQGLIDGSAKRSDNKNSDVLQVLLYPEIENESVIQSKDDVDISKIKVKVKRLGKKDLEEVSINDCDKDARLLETLPDGTQRYVISITYDGEGTFLTYYIKGEK